MTPAADGESLTIATVARVLGVCERTVQRLIKSGKLPAFKVGRVIRVARTDLLEFRKRNKVATT